MICNFHKLINEFVQFSGIVLVVVWKTSIIFILKIMITAIITHFMVFWSLILKITLSNLPN